MEYFNQFIQTFSDRKKAMGLTCPGPLENLHKEARSVSVSHFLFEGGKLDLGKMLSNNFQLSHSFNLGSSQVAPSYHLGSVFVGTKVLGHLASSCFYSRVFVAFHARNGGWQRGCSRKVSLYPE